MAALRRVVECVSPNPPSADERWGEVVSIERGRGVGGTFVDEHDLPIAKRFGRRRSHYGTAFLPIYGGQVASDSSTVSTASAA